MMTPEKLRSFIKLCKKECVEIPILVAHFPEFSDSNETDAYDFYINRGCHNLCEPVSKVRICQFIVQSCSTPRPNFGNHRMEIVKKVMQHYGGRLDPYFVKEVVEEFLDEPIK